MIWQFGNLMIKTIKKTARGTKYSCSFLVLEEKIVCYHPGFCTNTPLFFCNSSKGIGYKYIALLNKRVS